MGAFGLGSRAAAGVADARPRIACQRGLRGPLRIEAQPYGPAWRERVDPASSTASTSAR